jgi:hypothetical protein
MNLQQCKRTLSLQENRAGDEPGDTMGLRSTKFALDTLKSIEGLFDLYLEHMVAVELAGKAHCPCVDRIEAAAPLVDF